MLSATKKGDNCVESYLMLEPLSYPLISCDLQFPKTQTLGFAVAARPRGVSDPVCQRLAVLQSHPA